ncbi:TolC family protein [Mariprofundus ferrooxydans]|uniref:Outer membrane protein CyaE, putative n=1 Tax=Mariprofundus ferrooxydans PV-1 TaxID=314345 RepID=Q0EXQ3_9PROT|nr:TolC family protein [Mariprofundus ferrooxydans]EAU53994.1 outer membrane protein CyaE, putative [Mariprofundus ferrooxydans PV-1]
MREVFFCSKTSVIRYTLILAVLASGAMPATAETFTLKQSIAMALQHNRLLAADQYRVQAAASRVDEANGHLLPSLDAGYSIMRSDSPLTVFGTKLMQQRVTSADFNPVTLNNPSAINNYQPKLTLSMPLYQGGALWAGRKQAEQGALASTSEHLWLRQQTIFQTIQTYMAWLNAEAQLKAARKSLEASARYLSNVKSMRKRGMLIDSDVMDAQVHYLQNEVRVNQSLNGVAYARDLLARLTGVTAKENDQPAAVPDFGTIESTSGLEEAAIKQRPDLQAMQSTLESSKAAVDMEKASFMPHVSLQATQEWNSSTPSVRNGNATLAAQVSMNLYSGGSDKAAISRREADVARLSLQLDDKQQQIINQVRQAERQLTEAQKRSKAESEAMKQARESLRITELRHGQGLEKTSDLLNAQSRADMAEAEAIRAGYDVSVAKANLLLVSGRLSEESLQ